MKRILTYSLLTIACLSIQAQTTWYQAKPMPTQKQKQDVKFLAKCDAFFMLSGKTQKTTPGTRTWAL